MNSIAPILLFVYNRPYHTKLTLEALSRNKTAEQSELFIFSDGPKPNESSEKIDYLRDYLKQITGFKKVTLTERKSNYGLAKSIISGVSEIFQKYNKLIVVEDDLITSPNFLVYMNCLLSEYEDVKSIYSISGYSFPINLPTSCESIYLATRASSWGWGTWKNRWENVDWNVLDFESFIKNKESIKAFNRGGKDLSKMLLKQVKGELDSWAVRWSYHHFKNNAYCVYPKISKVSNIGQDNSGRHSIKTNKYNVILDTADNFKITNTDIMPNTLIQENFRRFFEFPIWERAFWFIKKKLNF